MSYLETHHMFSHEGLLHAVVDERHSVIHASKLAVVDEKGEREPIKGITILEVARALRALRTRRASIARAVKACGPPDAEHRAVMSVVSVLEAHGCAPSSGRVADLAKEIVAAVGELRSVVEPREVAVFVPEGCRGWPVDIVPGTIHEVVAQFVQRGWIVAEVDGHRVITRPRTPPGSFPPEAIVELGQKLGKGDGECG